MQIDTWTFVCCILLLMAFLSFALRWQAQLLMRSTRAIGNRARLQAAELAYLMRPGDSSHCIIVLIVDLVQKGLKRKNLEIDKEVMLVPYETSVWNAVKTYIKEWSIQKAQELVPEVSTKNPIKIAAGFWKIRFWLMDVLTNALTELVKDPRNLKRYFSPTGLLRVFLTVVSSGVKVQVTNEIRAVLLSHGLLVTDDRRRKFAMVFLLLTLVHVGALTFFTFQLGSVWQIITLMLFGAFNGIFLRAMKSLPLLLPFYEEVVAVLDSVHRKGLRIKIMRVVLKFVRFLFWTIVTLALIFFVVSQALIMSFLVHLNANNWLLNIVALIGLTLNFAIVFDLFLLSCNVKLNDQTSSEGQLQLAITQQNLKKVSLIDSFSETLTTAEYNQQLSEIVAIYGVETLFLLA